MLTRQILVPSNDLTYLQFVERKHCSVGNRLSRWRIKVVDDIRTDCIPELQKKGLLTMPKSLDEFRLSAGRQIRVMAGVFSDMGPKVLSRLRSQSYKAPEKIMSVEAPAEIQNRSTVSHLALLSKYKPGPPL